MQSLQNIVSLTMLILNSQSISKVSACFGEDTSETMLTTHGQWLPASYMVSSTFTISTKLWHIQTWKSQGAEFITSHNKQPVCDLKMRSVWDLPCTDLWVWHLWQIFVQQITWWPTQRSSRCLFDMTNDTMLAHQYTHNILNQQVFSASIIHGKLAGGTLMYFTFVVCVPTSAHTTSFQSHFG